jgi:3-hydroxyisobutyrate dehydrogenase
MKIGFIGLGNVGSKLAGSLLRNKFDVTVRDVDRESASTLLDAGAQWGESGKAMAKNCDVIITCPHPPQSRLRLWRKLMVYWRDYLRAKFG